MKLTDIAYYKLLPGVKVYNKNPLMPPMNVILMSRTMRMILFICGSLIT
jgi:hypothetical protein